MFFFQFVYVNQSFAPSLDVAVGVLFEVSFVSSVCHPVLVKDYLICQDNFYQIITRLSVHVMPVQTERCSAFNNTHSNRSPDSSPVRFESWKVSFTYYASAFRMRPKYCWSPYLFSMPKEIKNPSHVVDV